MSEYVATSQFFFFIAAPSIPLREHSHCRETPFEAGPFVSFFAVLVSAKLDGRCSSALKFFEKTRFIGCPGKNPEKLHSCLDTTRLRTQDLHVNAHVSVPTRLRKSFSSSQDNCKVNTLEDLFCSTLKLLTDRSVFCPHEVKKLVVPRIPHNYLPLSGENNTGKQQCIPIHAGLSSEYPSV